MAFIALRKHDNERIDITALENPHDEIKSGECICQLCDEPMIVKAGLILAPHFAHYSKCTSDYESHPESSNHRRGKAFVADYLKGMYSEYLNSMDIQFEVKIPKAKRIADVMLTLPMGWRIAHEVQLSSITTGDLQKRTDDYAKAGVDTVWWLGEKADTETNRDWCRVQRGGSMWLGFPKK